MEYLSINPLIRSALKEPYNLATIVGVVMVKPKGEQGLVESH
jgi:hypothetical protein